MVGIMPPSQTRFGGFLLPISFSGNSSVNMTVGDVIDMIIKSIR